MHFLGCPGHLSNDFPDVSHNERIRYSLENLQKYVTACVYNYWILMIIVIQIYGLTHFLAFIDFASFFFFLHVFCMGLFAFRSCTLSKTIAFSAVHWFVLLFQGFLCCCFFIWRRAVIRVQNVYFLTYGINSNSNKNVNYVKTMNNSSNEFNYYMHLHNFIIFTKSIVINRMKYFQTLCKPYWRFLILVSEKYYIQRDNSE